MNGEYIIRTKSSLTGKRVKHDPAFANTMKYAGWLKQGSRIASRIYRLLPDEKRVYKRYRELTGKAMHLLKEGFDTGDVIAMLEAVYLQPIENKTNEGTDRYYEGYKEYHSEYRRQYVGINSSGDLTEYCSRCCGKYTDRSNSGKSSEYHSGYRRRHWNEYPSVNGVEGFTEYCSRCYGKNTGRSSNGRSGEYHSDYRRRHWNEYPSVNSVGGFAEYCRRCSDKYTNRSNSGKSSEYHSGYRRRHWNEYPSVNSVEGLTEYCRSRCCSKCIGENGGGNDEYCNMHPGKYADRNSIGNNNGHNSGHKTIMVYSHSCGEHSGNCWGDRPLRAVQGELLALVF